jgi:membrane-bound hydrogenase subunit alpha
MSFEIPIGPQHPALKEPISLRMTVEGEVITGVDIRLGYNHRGMEKLAEEKTWLQNIYVTERICGICSHSHATCYVQGVEKLMELAPPRRGLYIRYLVSELERVHSHLLWLGVAGHEAGFDSFFMYTWRDREIVMDLLEMISGNRVHYAINTIGGVRRDIDEGQKAKILEGVATLRKRSEYYFRIGANEPSFVARIAGVGMLSKEQAIALCAVGPVARASGVARDVRKEDPYAVYDELDFDLATADSCDVLGRVVVRVKELLESYKMIEQMVKGLPDGDIVCKAPRKAKPGEAVSRYEAPRGENIHYIKANGSDKPERLKVRAPTLGNYPATVEMLRNGFIADIPLIFAAIDPCICCAERTVTLVGARSGEESVVRMSDLRRQAIARFRNAAVKRNAVWPL